MIAFVQSASGNSNSSSPATTGSITTTRGNLVVAAISDSTASPVLSMSDSYRNVWKQIGSTISVNNEVTGVFYSVLTTGGSGHTFSGADSGFAPSIAVVVQEFSGVWSFPFDVKASASGTGGTGSSGNTVVTSATSELLVGVTTSGVSSITLGAGYSNLVTQTDGAGSTTIGMESQLVAATGAYSATFGGTGSFWNVVIATFHERSNLVTGKLRPHPFSPGIAR